MLEKERRYRIGAGARRARNFALWSMGVVAIALAIHFPPLASAQRIAIEAPTKESRIVRPHRGMTTAEVEQRFGGPRERHGPVGAPPISRWVYAKITVYFEHERVIHSVVNRSVVNRAHR